MAISRSNMKKQISSAGKKKKKFHMEQKKLGKNNGNKWNYSF